jgi:hypothetical protein
VFGWVEEFADNTNTEILLSWRKGVVELGLAQSKVKRNRRAKVSSSTQAPHRTQSRGYVWGFVAQAAR